MTDRVTVEIFEKELRPLIPHGTLLSIRSDQPLSAQNHVSWFASMTAKIRQHGLLFILEEDLDDGLWNLRTFKHFHGILRDQIIENVASDLREQVSELETAGEVWCALIQLVAGEVADDVQSAGAKAFEEWTSRVAPSDSLSELIGAFEPLKPYLPSSVDPGSSTDLQFLKCFLLAVLSPKYRLQPAELFPMIDAPLNELPSSLETMVASALDQTIKAIGIHADMVHLDKEEDLDARDALSALDQTIKGVDESPDVALLDEKALNDLILRLAKDLSEVVRKIVVVNKEMLMNVARSTEKDNTKVHKIMQDGMNSLARLLLVKFLTKAGANEK